MSPQVRREVERAVHLERPIIPFRIDGVEPCRAMQYFISSQHWLDALTPPLEKHLRHLADILTSLLSGKQEAESLSQQYTHRRPVRSWSARSIAVIVAVTLVALAIAVFALPRLTDRSIARESSGPDDTAHATQADARQKSADPTSKLIGFIQSDEPSVWDTNGGSYVATVSDGLLKVKADWEVQIRIHDMLDALRTKRGLPVTPPGDRGESRTDFRQIRNIVSKLDEPTNIDFVETPLQDLLTYLGDLRHVKFNLDSRALAKCGMSPETQITCNVKSVSLRTALQSALKDLGLIYKIDATGITITTIEERAASTVTRVLDVHDLLGEQGHESDFGPPAAPK